MKEVIRCPYGRPENDKRNLSKNESLSSKSLTHQKFSKIEKLHQPDTTFVYLLNTTKSDNFFLSPSLSCIYIYIHPCVSIKCCKRRVFLSVSCQQHPNCQIFRIDCVISHQWIFQTQRGHRRN